MSGVRGWVKELSQGEEIESMAIESMTIESMKCESMRVESMRVGSVSEWVGEWVGVGGISKKTRTQLTGSWWGKYTLGNCWPRAWETTTTTSWDMSQNPSLNRNQITRIGFIRNKQIPSLDVPYVFTLQLSNYIHTTPPDCLPPRVAWILPNPTTCLMVKKHCKYATWFSYTHIPKSNIPHHRL